MVNVKVKKLLVPIDFSDCSQAAIEHAISLAQAFQAQVFLLHVMEPPAYGLDFLLTHPGVPPEIKQKLIEAMKQSVDKMRKLGIDAEGYFVTGVPFVEIIKAAKKHEADLIVMGTHGRTGLSHILLGSTAERVIQRTDCPVLTAKAAGRPSIPEKKERPIEEQARSMLEDLPADKGVTFCHLCGQPSKDIICEACKIRVQAEAFERKQRIEKEGR
jgi:nucleotide-binding universal stress UspA family protein